MFVLIMYDISDNKVRNSIENLLSSYGDRVNYSVFEIQITKNKFKNLISKIEKFTSNEDNIRIYILDKHVVKKSFTLHKKGQIFENRELYF